MTDWSCMKINLLEKVEKATRKRYIWAKDAFRLLPNKGRIRRFGTGKTADSQNPDFGPGPAGPRQNAWGGC